MQTHNAGDAESLIIEDVGAVRVLRMNRPDKHNALNTDLTTRLLKALQQADLDRDVRAIVLKGEGPSFCAGADLSEFRDLTPENNTLVLERANLTCELHMFMQQCSKPVIGVAHGNALGGGAGLAIACDILIAVDGIRFGYPEMKHSIVPALVMTGLQRQIPRKLAFQMITLGKLLDSGQMADAGLSTETAPSLEQGVAMAMEMGERLSLAHPKAMAATKELFYRVGDLPFEAAMAAGRDVNIIMRGFREKA